MEISFSIVDAGCYMHESTEGRWVIIHPYNGYYPTESEKWDLYIEHPEKPNSEPVKFLGSFTTMNKAEAFVKRKISKRESYFTVIPTENKYYNKDYSRK